jgi:rfaE bifunctional protein nucleotidyltransferase chain/domain
MSEPFLPAPLLDDAGLDRFLEAARASRLRLVFTNGCFDLIHPGHVAYLSEARSLGDRLIVGLNTDAGVRRLKGPERPLVPQEGRAAVLCALRCVDAVVLFGADTPRDLILRIRPQILVKGGDYTPETVVGASDLPAWGGTLRILPFLPGYSTSEIADRLRNPKGHNPFSA